MNSTRNDNLALREQLEEANILSNNLKERMLRSKHKNTEIQNNLEKKEK